MTAKVGTGSAPEGLLSREASGSIDDKRLDRVDGLGRYDRRPSRFKLGSDSRDLSCIYRAIRGGLAGLPFFIYPRIRISLRFEVDDDGLTGKGTPKIGALSLIVHNQAAGRSEHSDSVTAWWDDTGVNRPLLGQDWENERSEFTDPGVWGTSERVESPGSQVVTLGYSGPTSLPLPKGSTAMFLLCRTKEGADRVWPANIGLRSSLKIGETGLIVRVKSETRRAASEKGVKRDTRHYRIGFDAWDSPKIEWEFVRRVRKVVFWESPNPTHKWVESPYGWGIWNFLRRKGERLATAWPEESFKTTGKGKSNKGSL